MLAVALPANGPEFMWNAELIHDFAFMHRLLFELDTKTDPVWHCLSSQYRWIKKIMSESFDEQIVLVEGMAGAFCY